MRTRSRGAARRRVRALRPLLVTLAAAAVTAVATGVAASPAAATVGDAICAGTASSVYSPGLTNTPQSVTVTNSNMYACRSLNDPRIRSASSRVTATVTRSCTDLLTSAVLVVENTYNTGERSTITANYSASYVAGQFVIVLRGSITAGKFRGAPILVNTTQVADLTDCLTSAGLRSLFGPSEYIVL